MKIKLWSHTSGKKGDPAKIHGFVELVNGEYVYSGDRPEHIRQVMEGEIAIAARDGITDKAEILRRMHERPKSYGGWTFVDE